MTATLALVVACGSDRTTPSVDGGDRPNEADGGGGMGGDGALPVARMYVHSDTVLYTVDDESFDLIEIGPFNLGGSAMNDLAVTPDGELYGLTASQLYRINRSTAAATFVAPVTGTSNVGMTFLPDGSLLAADKNGAVRRVQPQSGAVSELGEYGDGYGTAGDLVAVADGTMYAIADDGPGGDASDNNLLLKIDPATGVSLEVVGPIGFTQVWGVAYASGHIYAFTFPGEIIEINPATGAGTLVRTHAGVGFYGAGVTPLVEVE